MKELEPVSKCLRCATDLGPEHRFCHRCGMPTEPSYGIPTEAETLFMPKLASPLEPGDTFADRFLVERQIGGGGMGVVYQIQEKSSELRLALKVLKPALSRDPDASSRFEREIRILSRLRHPSIPRIVEWGHHQDSLFFISELIEGEDLRQRVERSGKLPLRTAMPILTAMVEALASAHQAGIVHRDLKPANVMISKTGQVYLIDFGVARSIAADLTRLTETGLFVGTPQYMSPEQLDSHRADERSDIYSLGVVFFEVLTGSLPFAGESPIAIATKHLKERPPSPRAVTPTLPFWMERIILRCLEKDPALRYWTVTDLLADLRKNHSGQVVKRTALPNGDIVFEDPSGSKGWALRINTSIERPAWTVEVSLHFRDAFYRYLDHSPPAGDRKTWEYRFERWPESQMMRRILDYETEAQLEAGSGSIFSRAKKWLKGSPS